MDVPIEDADVVDDTQARRSVVSALRGLPDRSAADVGELTRRIGADKLLLIRWVRTDSHLARLVASKIRS